MSVVQPVVADVGSLELTLTRLSYNQLLLFVEGMLTAIAAATDIASLQSGIAALSVAGLQQVVATKELPLPPLLPTYTATP